MTKEKETGKCSFWNDKSGNSLKPATINRYIKKTLIEIGLKDFNTQKLRELATQQFANAGADIRSIQRLRQVKGLRRLKTLYRKNFDELQKSFNRYNQRKTEN